MICANKICMDYDDDYDDHCGGRGIRYDGHLCSDFIKQEQLESKGPPTDTERLDFILKYFDVEDVGDDELYIGVRINSEPLEDALGFAKHWNESLRDIIDRTLGGE